MQFQRAQPSIVRSIRHISLFKGWQRACRADTLPSFSDFVPDDRAGDSADMLIAEARLEGENIFFYCRSAGARVEQIFDTPISERYFHDAVDLGLLAGTRPIWLCCINDRMPIFSVFALTDSNGCPVTIEQIFLPYRTTGEHADVIVSAIHAWSTEGGFAIRGLLSNLAVFPSHQTVIIDAALAAVTINRNDASENG